MFNLTLTITDYRTIVVIFFISLFSIFIWLIQRYFGRQKAIIWSLLFGLIGGIIYYFLTKSINTVNYDDLTNETSSWLTLFTVIFITLISLIVPLYILSTIMTTITKTRHDNYSKKLLITSFTSLWLMSFLGIIVAISLTPLIKIINIPSSSNSLFDGGTSTPTTITGILSGLFPSEFWIFLLSGSILSVVGVSIFFAYIVRTMHIKNHDSAESIISFFDNLRELCNKYLKIIVIGVPYVIFTRLPILFDHNTIVEMFTSMALFLTVFALGLFIVYTIEYILVLILTKNRKGNKKTLFSLFGSSLVKNSAPVLLPDTIKTAKKFGVDDNIANVTPSLGTSMGMSMCGGFYPALVAIMSANLSTKTHGEMLTLSFYIILIIVIMFASLGMTGVPGADIAVTLSVVNGVGASPMYFATVYVFDGIIDSFRTTGNSLGFVLATIITYKIMNKYYQKK